MMGRFAGVPRAERCQGLPGSARETCCGLSSATRFPATWPIATIGLSCVRWVPSTLCVLWWPPAVWSLWWHMAGKLLGVGVGRLEATALPAAAALLKGRPRLGVIVACSVCISLVVSRARGYTSLIVVYLLSFLVWCYFVPGLMACRVASEWRKGAETLPERRESRWRATAATRRVALRQWREATRKGSR